MKSIPSFHRQVLRLTWLLLCCLFVFSWHRPLSRQYFSNQRRIRSTERDREREKEEERGRGRERGRERERERRWWRRRHIRWNSELQWKTSASKMSTRSQLTKDLNGSSVLYRVFTLLVITLESNCFPHECSSLPLANVNIVAQHSTSRASFRIN